MRLGPSVPKSRMRITTDRPPLDVAAFSQDSLTQHQELLLRRVFAHSSTAQPLEVAGDESSARDSSPLVAAAVLVPLVLRETEITVLLTQRNARLKNHPGQISFPGGRIEACDASALAAALREAEEEVGLPAAHVEVMGTLPQYRTVTGFRITPVVGLVRPPLALRIDPREVAEAFEVPLAFLVDPHNRQRHSIDFHGRQRSYSAIPYGERYIWGATAGMIVQLAERLQCGQDTAEYGADVSRQPG